MCVEVKSSVLLGSSMSKNPQLRTSAFYPLHPQISSAKIIRILPVSISTRPHVHILPLALSYLLSYRRSDDNTLYGQLADRPTRRQTNSPTHQFADRPTRRQDNSPTSQLADNQLAHTPNSPKIDKLTLRLTQLKYLDHRRPRAQTTGRS